jgi:formylglycine-generating enzyme required for sulfatase activity
MTTPAAPRLVHRTAHIRLRVTRRQACRCYGLLRSAGDVWAWLLDTNRQRHQQGEPAISNYQALCRELVKTGGDGLAWPRATHSTIRCRVGVARHASSTWRLARIR